MFKVEVHSLWPKASANPAIHAKHVKLREQHIKSHSIIIPSELLLFKTYMLNYTIASQQSMCQGLLLTIYQTLLYEEQECRSVFSALGVEILTLCPEFLH